MTPMVSAKEAIDLVRSLAEASYEELPDRAFSAQLLIAKIDAEEADQKKLNRYARAAINGFHEGDHDFDDDEWLIVSESEEGAYVSCWVWVSNEDAKENRHEEIKRMLENINMRQGHVCDDGCRSNGCKENR